MQYARRLQAPSDTDDANDDKGGTSGPNDTCRKCVQIILALQHSALTDRTLQICLKEPSRLQLLNSLRLREVPHGSNSLQQPAEAKLEDLNCNILTMREGQNGAIRLANERNGR